MASKYGTGSVALSRQRLLEARRAGEVRTETAAQAFSRTYVTAMDRLEQVERELRSRAAAFGPDGRATGPVNWAQVGDMAAVVERLGLTLQSLGFCACGQFSIDEYGEHCPSELGFRKDE